MSGLEIAVGTPALLAGALALAVALCVRHGLRVRGARHGIREQHRQQWARREDATRHRHDGLVQSLLGVVMQLHAATARLPGDHAARRPLEAALAGAEQMITNDRGAIGHPGEMPSDDDLCTALSDAARCLEAEGAARVEVVAVGRQRSVNAKALFTAYRIAWEALLNALRHAHASHVTVDVVYDRAELRVRVRDDGTGFFVPPGMPVRRSGLARMQGLAQRLAGSLCVLSVMGGGTAVEFRLGAGHAYDA